jgi:hypothetical protein
MFLHECANVIWSLKGPEGPPLFVLVTIFHEGISITLQRMQTSSILSWAIIISLVISDFHPFKTHPQSLQLTCYKLLVVEMESF